MDHHRLDPERDELYDLEADPDEFTKAKGKWGYIEAVQRGKDPTIFVVLFEDSAAMLGLMVAFFGVWLSNTTGILYFDGIASVIIGFILGGTAVWLAYETKSLLIGEAAKRLSGAFQAAHNQIPWAQIMAMRNRLIHGYDRINWHLVWKTTTEDVPHLLTVLEGDESLGLVSGMLKLENGNWFACENYNKGLVFGVRNNVLYRTAAPKKIQAVDGIKYQYADQVVNFFLARTEIFRNVRWDNRIKVEYEHMDFFLSLKRTKWKAAACLDATAIHLRSELDPAYYAHRNASSNQYFLSKWGYANAINQF